MRLEAVMFFQPVMVIGPDPARRAPLITSARSDEFDMELDGDKIWINRKGQPERKTFATIYNTCWAMPLVEVVNEPSPSKSDLERASKTKGKRNTVALKQLPTAD